MFAYILPYLNAIILLLTASPIYSYPELIAIYHDISCFYVWFIFMNVYICVPYIYVFNFVAAGHHGNIQQKKMKKSPPPPPPPRFPNFPIYLRHP